MGWADQSRRHRRALAPHDPHRASSSPRSPRQRHRVSPQPGLTLAGRGRDTLAGESLSMASNAWAIGAERSAGGRGMLLANPHWFWTGSGRFWEKHLTIPGELDVYGVNELGAARRRHRLQPRRRVDPHRLGRQAVHVLRADARPRRSDRLPLRRRRPSHARSRRARWTCESRTGRCRRRRAPSTSAHYGPLLNLPGLGWTAAAAVDLSGRQRRPTCGPSDCTWRMGRAPQPRRVQEAHAEHGGPPFVNTIAASADGRAWYADACLGAEPHAAAIAEWLPPARERSADARPSTRAARFSSTEAIPASSGRRRARPARPRPRTVRARAPSSSAATTCSTPTTAPGCPTRPRDSTASRWRTGAEGAARTLRTRMNALLAGRHEPVRPGRP